jgi:hypothetical protein
LRNNPNRCATTVVLGNSSYGYGNSTRQTNLAGFLQSDRIRTLDLPPSSEFLTIARSIESAMEA